MKRSAAGVVLCGVAWAAKIVANPGGFYVIIGTGRYPNGAIGGVLSRA